MNQFIFTINAICLVIALSFSVVYADDEMGPADLYMERVEECENAMMYPTPMGIELSKVNRTHSGVSSCLELGRSMDKLVTMNVSVAKWGDGGWKPNILNYFSDDACKTMKEHLEESWHTFLEASGAVTNSCPLEEGKYCVDKLVVDMAGTFPSLMYGDLRVDAEIFVEGRAHRCVRLFIKSEPRKGGPPPPKQPGPPPGGM